MQIISGYKVRIILWYTGLLALIVTALFYILNTILVHELKHDVAREVSSKAKRIGHEFAQLDDQSTRREKFFHQALPDRHTDLWDVRELLDYPDDKFLFGVLRGD